MRMELKTISTSKFLLITLLSIPMIIGIPISLALLLDNAIFIVLIVVFDIFTIYNNNGSLCFRKALTFSTYKDEALCL